MTVMSYHRNDRNNHSRNHHRRSNNNRNPHNNEYREHHHEDDLRRALTSLDGKSYGAYKSLRGSYPLAPGITLSIDRVQTDPYAPPSLMRILVDLATAQVPQDLINDAEGKIATGDFLTRAFSHEAYTSKVAREVSIGRPGQAVLERTSILFTDKRLEARIMVALPAAGRRIRGREAEELLADILPEVAEYSLLYKNLDQQKLRDHVILYRDQQDLRRQLNSRKLVAFVGNGAILPRRSGDSDEPLEQSATPFQSPQSLHTEFSLPSGRTITGMGVPEGITVIVGGGYHGKSTLLKAMERGVYSHILNDGREWVITHADAMAIRAEDGRAVTGVDISPFINNLPSGTDTHRFFTTNASGSTSQATNLVEALEAGAQTLLIDEDTSATNFMIRDERMQQLIPAKDEPITPFVQRIRPLFTEKGVSTILVAGGSGAFFDVADHVIALNSYVPNDVTVQAHSIANRTPQNDAASLRVFDSPNPRVPARDGLQEPSKTKPAKARSRTDIQYGRENIDLIGLMQLIDAAQTTGIAHALDSIAGRCDGSTSLAQLVDQLVEDLDEHGLDVLSPHRGHPGLFARPRSQEIMAAVNRYRKLRLSAGR